MFLASSCSCLCPIQWSHALSRRDCPRQRYWDILPYFSKKSHCYFEMTNFYHWNLIRICAILELVWNSPIVLQVQAYPWVENEDVVGAAPTGDAPTTSEGWTISLPTMVQLILETWRYCIWIFALPRKVIQLGVWKPVCSKNTMRTKKSCCMTKSDNDVHDFCFKVTSEKNQSDEITC